MPLKLKLRGEVWHLEGRIDELPESDYYRRSTKKTNYEHAQTALRHFKNNELKKFYGGGDISLPFIDAVAAYDPSPEFSSYLLKVLPYLQDKTVAEIDRLDPASNSIGVSATTTENSNSNHVAIWPNFGVASS